MQLADDDALGAVDDEGALRRHQRQFAHENFFFLGALFLLEKEGHMQGRAKSDALAKAFQPVVLGFADFVAVKIQNALAIIAFDGKTSVKTACKPVFLRRDGGESVWRNSLYEFVCNSIRLGGAMTSLILPKWTRSVGLHGICNLWSMSGHGPGFLFGRNDERQRSLTSENAPNQNSSL